MSKLPLAVAAILSVTSCRLSPETQKSIACAQAIGAVRAEIDKLFTIYDSCWDGAEHIFPYRERFCFEEGLYNAADNMRDKCGNSIDDDSVTRCLNIALRDCDEVMKRSQPVINE